VLVSKSLNERESVWYSGKKPYFHPSKPVLTPARVNFYKKTIKTTKCAFNDLELQGVLKKKFGIVLMKVLECRKVYTIG